MANLNNSSNTFAYMSAATAPRRQTPASLKRSYRQTLAADKTYDALINATLRQYGNVQPLQRTAQYRNLVNLYNQAYMQNALAAANAAQRMSAGAAAGYGNSYAAAVSAGALDRHMAKRGEAMPALMAVAQKAYQNDKSGKLKAIRAMRAQRSLQTNAARDLLIWLAIVWSISSNGRQLICKVLNTYKRSEECHAPLSSPGKARAKFAIHTLLPPRIPFFANAWLIFKRAIQNISLLVTLTTIGKSVGTVLILKFSLVMSSPS